MRPKFCNILSKASLLTLLMILGTGLNPVSAQNAYLYLVLFKDKTGTPHRIDQPDSFLSTRSIQRRMKQHIPVRESDLPVNPEYVTAVRNTGAQILHTTRWFNGVVVNATDEQMETIRSLPFFKEIEKDRALNLPRSSARMADKKEKFTSTESIDYGTSRMQLEMLGVPNLHEMGFTGKGLLIGVFDAGFYRANNMNYLRHLFNEGHITDTYDFISRDKNVYDDHTHGLQVLSAMASRLEGQLVGPAFEADYLLYRTENDAIEYPYEEVAWLLAAERADSIGVDLINTSLGYYDFDNPVYNYAYSEMDGRTTIISRAARMAARCGILLVNAAGNEGNNSWRHITAPADVDSVLTVGAVTSAGNRASFSSIGPNAEGLIKPDVVALGSGVRLGASSGGITTSQGTSFASPLIASFAALLWQKFPEKTAQELADYIRSLGSKADNPDNELGYGLPFFDNRDPFPDFDGFTAELINNVVHLTWSHPDLERVSHFEIQRTESNELTFKTIDTVTNATTAEDILNESGSFMYRIVAVSTDGEVKYSAITRVVFYILSKEPMLYGFRLWPNPVNDKLFVEIQEETAFARILDITGSVRLSANLVPNAAGQAEIRVSHLPAGLYILHLQNSEGQIVTQKFIKP